MAGLALVFAQADAVVELLTTRADVLFLRAAHQAGFLLAGERPLSKRQVLSSRP
jgi:hypothetical protein